MILDTNIRLEAVLAAGVATTQPEYHVCFRDRNRSGEDAEPGLNRGALNSATDVTILSAPGELNPRREIEELSIFNKDTASVTVTVKTDDGATERIVIKVTLATLETLFYDRNGGGWYAVTVAGARK